LPPLVLVAFFAFMAMTLLTAEDPFPDGVVAVQENENRVGQAKIQPDMAELPLSFIANAGQADANVRFVVEAGTQTIFFTPQEIVFAASEQTEGEVPRSSVVRIRFAGSNGEVELRGSEPLPGVANFFLGSNPEQWRTNVPTYAAITYHDLYPGIDLIYSGKQGQLKSQFVVAAGVDPTAITMDCSGASRMYVRGDGALALETAMGELVEASPFIYQMIDDKRVTVDGSYRLLGEEKATFTLGEYEPSEPLIIDPVLFYSSYLGGSSNDYGHGITVDTSGNAYITGHTHSIDFPTQNPLQPNHCGADWDAFVLKLNASGSTLVYSTFLGGSSSEQGLGIAVDGSGNVCITGGTTSDDFPTQNPLQPNHCGADWDAFVLKLNASGSTLVYSTYLGGAMSDVGKGIAVDGLGNAYVVGVTRSASFPTQDPLQPYHSNTRGWDAFISKLNASGSTLVYSTYLGGNNVDQGHAIAVDSSGNAYITGHTSSTDFPTKNPLQSSRAGWDDDVFLTKLNPEGSGLVYSTYLGGIEEDHGCSIAVDGSGNAYITGYTWSIDFPTQDPLQSNHSGYYEDAFALKVSASGSAVVYSTYLGGAMSDVGEGIAVDGSGNAYITGYTKSTDFPTQNPLQSDCAGRMDIFVAKLNPAGSGLLYSTYLGGTDNEHGSGIAVDALGNAYITGWTSSIDFPTQSPLQPDLGDGDVPPLYGDAFVAKIREGAIATIYVPDDCSSIQAAVDAADPGDTIIVRQGIYTENVDVNKDNLTIRSENGATQTTIEIGTETGFVLNNSGVIVTGFRIQGDPTGAPIGVHIDGTAGCEVSNSRIENCGAGVRVDASTSATISNNELVGRYCGVFAYDSSMLTIQGNTIDGCPESGLCLWFVEDSLVSGNEISPEHSMGSHGGICLLGSSDNSIIDNTFVDDGIVVRDKAPGSSSNNTMTGNTVNGKEIVYLEGSSSLSISEAGQVILVACDNIAVVGLDLSGTIVPIQLVRSNNCQVSNNQVTPSGPSLYDNGFFSRLGVFLQGSADNAILDNSGGGVCLIASGANIVQGNNAWPYEEMLMLYHSTGNQIVQNAVSYIGLRNSKNNTIYLNNIQDGIYYLSASNLWSSPEERSYNYQGTLWSSYLGNYWYDYTGNDADGDGIGDTPYGIDGDADDYPLMEPFENYVGDTNELPVANAGHDQVVTDTDDNGQEEVTLDGSGSYDSDGEIVSWMWSEGETEIAEGETPTVSLSIGNHTITLAVTDNEGAAGTDDVVVEVRSAGAGAILTATKSATDLNGGALEIGDEIEFTITITNSGSATQRDNAGNEFEDVLSGGEGNLGYVLGSAYASSGIAQYDFSSDPWHRKIIWNGSIPIGDSVEIRFTSPINWGTQAVNQGIVYYDADDNGTNEATTLTDDPSRPGSQDPTVLSVSPRLTMEFVDPVPRLVEPASPTGITANRFDVAFLGSPVVGVAADGTARILVRVEVVPSLSGDITFSIEDLELDGMSLQDGVLSTIDGTEVGPTVTVPIRGTGSSRFAYVVFYAPEDFVRPELEEFDEASSDRRVQIRAEFQGVCVSEILEIHRPPVALVHGLWGSRSGWDGFAPLHSVDNGTTHDDDRFYIRALDYESTNNDGFEVNDVRVLSQVMKLINDYKQSRHVAAVQADVIGHSMGGVLTRAAANHDRYLNPDMNYEEGYFHKVITIGTPHLGSRWASIIDEGYNAWDTLRDAFGMAENREGISDLAYGSVAIQGLTGQPGPSTHVIVGITPEPHSSSADDYLAALSYHVDAALFASIARVFDGNENDLIVGIDSQRGGFGAGAENVSTFTPVIHNRNTFLMSLSGCSVYETGDERIASRVIELLNFPIASGLFTPLPVINWGTASLPAERIYPGSHIRPESLDGILIESPGEGDVFQPGDAVCVVVVPKDGMALRNVFLGTPGFLLADATPPFEFAFQLPGETVGPRQISVTGLDANDNSHYAQITIDVAVSSAVLQLVVDPTAQELEVDDGLVLHVWGDFADGQRRDLTKATATSYESSDVSVVSVDSDGRITAVAEGSASVTVTYQGQSAVSNITVRGSNQSPTADAGSDLVAAVGEGITLDGTGSMDLDGDSLTYLWETVSKPAGSSPTLAPIDSQAPLFTPGVAGEYVIMLTVDDGKEGTCSDTVLITAWQSSASVFRVTAEGSVAADGTVRAASFETNSADLAEWVTVSERVEAGDVVAFDPTQHQSYRLTSFPCSSLVAGVVSSEPGITLGQDEVGDSSRALLALVGIVPVKVMNEGGPIQPGDLLVSSSTPGHAMRWSGPDPCPCSLVGKALEPMTDESGMILVLLTAH